MPVLHVLMVNLCPRYSYMLFNYKTAFKKRKEKLYDAIVPENMILQNWMHLTTPLVKQTKYYVAPVG